jgi:hypothetical protein
MHIVETRRIGEDVRVLLRPEAAPVPAPADAATPPPPAD